ncbi:hypothetical protein DVK01_20000 [Haloarcula sp. Atlit-120R]|nr:hypothetical protein DVK01_20000 [Haloarcula sp. Atlit-120R]
MYEGPAHQKARQVQGASVGRERLAESDLRCRLFGSALSKGLVATDSRHCCLTTPPSAGTHAEHGPVGPHYAVEW